MKRRGQVLGNLTMNSTSRPASVCLSSQRQRACLASVLRLAGRSWLGVEQLAYRLCISQPLSHSLLLTAFSALHPTTPRVCGGRGAELAFEPQCPAFHPCPPCGHSKRSQGSSDSSMIVRISQPQPMGQAVPLLGRTLERLASGTGQKAASERLTLG